MIRIHKRRLLFAFITRVITAFAAAATARFSFFYSYYRKHKSRGNQNKTDYIGRAHYDTPKNIPTSRAANASRYATAH